MYPVTTKEAVLSDLPSIKHATWLMDNTLKLWFIVRGWHGLTPDTVPLYMELVMQTLERHNQSTAISTLLQRKCQTLLILLVAQTLASLGLLLSDDSDSQALRSRFSMASVCIMKAITRSKSLHHLAKMTLKEQLKLLLHQEMLIDTSTDFWVSI